MSLKKNSPDKSFWKILFGLFFLRQNEQTTIKKYHKVRIRLNYKKPDCR